MYDHKVLPSVEYLKECFEYDDGSLIWRIRPRCHFKILQSWKMFNTRYSGESASYIRYIDSGNRYIVGINGDKYVRSRIIFAICKYSPNEMIDHIDGDSTNDHIENLREANKSQNAINSKLSKSSKTKYKGVYFHKKAGQFMSRLKINHRHIFLGYFDDPKLAHEAYCEAARKYFGEFARSE